MASFMSASFPAEVVTATVVGIMSGTFQVGKLATKSPHLLVNQAKPKTGTGTVRRAAAQLLVRAFHSGHLSSLLWRALHQDPGRLEANRLHPGFVFNQLHLGYVWVKN